MHLGFPGVSPTAKLGILVADCFSCAFHFTLKEHPELPLPETVSPDAYYANLAKVIEHALDAAGVSVRSDVDSVH